MENSYNSWVCIENYFSITPKTVKDKLLTHSLHGFTVFAKNNIIQNYNDVFYCELLFVLALLFTDMR